MSVEISTTLRSKQLLRSFFLASAALFGAISISGCASVDAPTLRYGPRSLVLQASYDEVWQAVQKALANYPIQVNNVDSGTIVTDSLKGSSIWAPPFDEKLKYHDFKYVLKVQVIRGKISGLDSCQIFVTKTSTARPDFFSGPVKLPSDGFEEGAILYRIERQVAIQRSLKNAFERESSSGGS